MKKRPGKRSPHEDVLEQVMSEAQNAKTRADAETVEALDEAIEQAKKHGLTDRSPLLKDAWALLRTLSDQLRTPGSPKQNAIKRKKTPGAGLLRRFGSSSRFKLEPESSMPKKTLTRHGTYDEGGSYFEEVVDNKENVNNYEALKILPKNDKGEISVTSFLERIEEAGIELTDARVKSDIKTFTTAKAKHLPEADFLEVLNHNTLLEAVFNDKFVVEQFSKKVAVLKRCLKAAEKTSNPKTWSFAACTIDGQQVELGDSATFSLMETCAPVLYAAAVRENGADVHKHVGKEPSGGGLDNRELASNNLPHNPYTKAGAIVCASLVEPEKSRAQRSQVMETLWKDLMGTAKGPTFNNTLYLKLRETNYMEYCLAYMLREVKAFPEDTDIKKTLDFYFMNLAMETNCKNLTRVAATLANGGLCPFTEQRVLSPGVVRDVLSLMQSCGMNDRSGNFQFDFGFPCKSGTSGSLMVVIPGLMGFAVHSPDVDSQGTSKFGYTLCWELTKRFRFHMLEMHIHPNIGRVTHRDDAEELDHLSFLFAATKGDVPLIRKMVARGININAPDYDLRTAMHLAAIEGHMNVVHYLTMVGASVNPRDRFYRTPLDDAKRNGHKQIVKFLSNPPKAAAFYKENESDAKNAKNRSAYIGSRNAIRQTNREAAELTRVSQPGAVDPKLNENEIAYFQRFLKSLAEVSGDTLTPPRVGALLDVLEESGLKATRFLKSKLSRTSPLTIDALDEILSAGPAVELALTSTLIIPEWKKFCDVIVSIYEECKSIDDGDVARYIPQLASVDPSKFGIAVCSIDGQTFAHGDFDEAFSVQSCSKTISYCIALETNPPGFVHKHVDREPSGKIFNNLALDRNDRPHNPLINAGAIMTVSMIRPDLSPSQRFEYVCSVWRDCSIRAPRFSNNTYLSELETADRNFSLGYLMREKGAFPEHVNSHAKLSEVLEQYFQICSLEMTCEELSVVAATLANGGVNPLTHKRVFKEEHVRNCLSIMLSSGMYDYSGQFQFVNGLPCKSGVAGALMIVVPGVCGICTWSPRLDSLGNSVRGVEFCNRFTSKYLVHLFDPQIPGMAMHKDKTTGVPKKDLKAMSYLNELQGVAKLAFAASKGDLYEIQRLVSLGIPINGSDYHGRTALHLAASEGQVKAVELLCKAGASLEAQDKWKMTPMQTAQHFKRSDVVSALESFIL